MTLMATKEIIDRIFKEPGIKYELTEFESSGKPGGRAAIVLPPECKSNELLEQAKSRVEQLIEEAVRS